MDSDKECAENRVEIYFQRSFCKISVLQKKYLRLCELYDIICDIKLLNRYLVRSHIFP